MIAPRARTAGAVAGAAAAAVFLILHAAWIVPIWQVAPIALLIGAAAGVAMSALRPPAAPLSGRPLAWPLEGAIRFMGCWLIVGPSVVVAALGLRAGVAPMPAVVLGLFGPSILVGSVVAILAARSWRAAPAGVLAGAVLAAGPGHNIPLLAARPAVPMELALLGAVFAMGAFVSVVVERWLTGWSRDLPGPAR